MRLSSSPAATCLASLCLATTTTRAFFVPSPALTDVSLARGHRSACARCTSPIPMQMATTNGDDVSNSTPARASKRAALLGHASKLFTRRRGATKGSAAMEVDDAGTGEVARLPKRQRRAREVMRRSFAAVATAVIVRSSFTAQPASAIMPKLRGSSAQQQVRQYCTSSLPLLYCCFLCCVFRRRCQALLPSGVLCFGRMVPQGSCTSYGAKIHM